MVEKHYEIKDEVILTNPDIIAVFRSEGKTDILKVLINQEMNIHELKNLLKLNPGSIKRHIDQLLEYQLIIQTKEEDNSWGVKMKYYRSVAKKFVINYTWPDEPLPEIPT